MQAQIEYEDPMITLMWENLLDDVNNAHNRMDDHEEHWDAWQHEFDVNMNQVSTWVFSVINDLRYTIEKQQRQIDELLMLTLVNKDIKKEMKGI